MFLKKHSVLPGFNLTIGFTVFYLSVIVFLPLCALFTRSFSLKWDFFWATLNNPRVLASLKLSIGISFLASLNNAFFGFILVWVLTRYRFFGQKIIDIMIDLPFAMPTAIAGITLTSLYAANGWVGQYLSKVGVKVAFTPLGVWVALTFVGLPFVVRTLQPILQDLDKEVEEAAASLGANWWQTFWRIILPTLLPGWLTGFGLAFARGLGEYGSVVFISGNLPFRTEIAPFLVAAKLEQYDYDGAVCIAVALLAVSFLLLLMLNYLQLISRRNK